MDELATVLMLLFILPYLLLLLESLVIYHQAVQ